MLIKNITGNSVKNAAKVIGIGNIMIQPDEEKVIPDKLAYVNELDDEGRETGNKVILPGILLQAKLGMLTYKETGKKPEKNAEKPVEEPKAEEEPAAEEPAAEEAPAAPAKKTGGRKTKKAE